MPPKRGRGPAKKYYVKRRRYNRRKLMRARVGSLRSSRRPYFYKQSFKLATLQWPTGTTPGTAPGLAYTFNITQLPNRSAFETLYDEYKICAVKFKYYPTSSTSYPGNVSYLIHSVIDYDDANVETTVDQMYQYQTLKTHRGMSIWSRYLKPRFNMGISGFTTGGSSKRGWIDLALPAVQHYGVKLFCEYPEGLSQGQNASIIVTMYVAFRSVR